MSAEKDQDTDDAKWRIPHNLGCGTFVQILKALYVQRDDANHATLKRLLSLTSLGKRTLVSNRRQPPAYGQRHKTVTVFPEVTRKTVLDLKQTKL